MKVRSVVVRQRPKTSTTEQSKIHHTLVQNKAIPDHSIRLCAGIIDKAGAQTVTNEWYATRVQLLYNCKQYNWSNQSMCETREPCAQRTAIVRNALRDAAIADHIALT